MNNQNYRGFFSSSFCFIAGLVLFLSTIFIIAWNEHRTNASMVAQFSQPIKDPSSPNTDGKFVSFTGPLVTPTPIQDKFFVSLPKTFVLLDRFVETFAYKEVSNSQTKPPSISYTTEWTMLPQNSDNFANKTYINPPNNIEKDSFTAEKVFVGPFEIPPVSILSMKNTVKNIQLTNGHTINPEWKISDDHKYLIPKNSNYKNPAVGDIRISFQGIEAGQTVTVFGKKTGTIIEDYEDPETGIRIMEVGLGNRKEALLQLRQEHLEPLWSIRIISPLLLWLGFWLFFLPFNHRMNWIVFFKKRNPVVSFFALFPLIMILSALSFLMTIFLSVIPTALFVIVIFAVLLFVYHREAEKNKAPNT